MTEHEYQDLATHAALCAERYRGIYERLRRIEYVLVGLLAILVLNGDGPLTALVGRLLGFGTP